MLGLHPGTSGRTGLALNHWAVSPVPSSCLLEAGGGVITSQEKGWFLRGNWEIKPLCMVNEEKYSAMVHLHRAALETGYREGA